MLTENKSTFSWGLAMLSYVLGMICFIVPPSVWAVFADRTGSGSGYFIAGFIFISPMVAMPGAIVAGVVAMPITERALKATTGSHSERVTFLLAAVLSAIIGIVATYITALIGVLILENIDIPNV